MRSNLHTTVPLGDLVVAVFDEAADFSTDKKEVSCLAIEAVAHLLRNAGRASSSLFLPLTCAEVADAS